MNNLKFTFTTATLDATSTGNPVVEPCDIDGSTPKNVFIINNCGKTIEVNFLSQKEKNEFSDDPTSFVGIPIPDGTTFSSKFVLEEDNARIIEYLLIAKAEAGSTTADLDVYCVDYI